jgi:hypothetical protein
VKLTMIANTSSVMTIDVMPIATGRKAAMRPPKTITNTASRMGNAMLSLMTRS